MWFEALSHKALRLAIPVLHLMMFGANLALAEFWFYQGMMAGQLVFYAAAMAGGFETHRASSRRSILLTVPYTMCLLGWATIVGFARIVARRQRVTWERMPGEPGPRVVSRPVFVVAGAPRPAPTRSLAGVVRPAPLAMCFATTVISLRKGQR